MDWPEVLAKLERAKAEFLRNDCYLLEKDANERSMTHKFADYLQRDFVSWTVDCEYNRDGDVPKELHDMADETVSARDECARTVFPDIIVHHRGEQASGELRNLLIIEAKKSKKPESRDAKDIKKLEAYRRQYAYRHTVLLLFVTKKDAYDIMITRC
jgi:hypothetical protein